MKEKSESTTKGGYLLAGIAALFYFRAEPKTKKALIFLATVGCERGQACSRKQPLAASVAVDGPPPFWCHTILANRCKCQCLLVFTIDLLPRLKAGDSYHVQEQDNTPESLRWVPAAGGITAPLTSQAIRASPALKTFIAPTTSAFS